MIKIVGKTSDGKYCLSGIYQLYATHGIPLDLIYDFLLEKNYIIAWDEFIKEGLSEGANLKTLMSKIKLLIKGEL